MAMVFRVEHVKLETPKSKSIFFKYKKIQTHNNNKKKQNMPFPFIAAAALGGSLIGGATTMGGNRANRRLQRNENQKNREYATQMWEKENAYNAPQAQMERLKAGGLNPNLVYGNGSVANTANPIQKPAYTPLENTDYSAIPDMVEKGVNLYADLRQQKLQNDNLQLEALSRSQEIALKAQFAGQQATATLEKTQSEMFKNNIKGRLDSVGLQNAQTLSDISVQHASQVVQNLGVQGESLKQDVVRKAIDNSTLSEKNKAILSDLYSRIENNKANKTRTEIETELQRMRKDLRSDGIEVTDSIYLRMLRALLNDDSDNKAVENAKKFHKKYK